jgi:hypothetical protein
MYYWSTKIYLFTQDTKYVSFPQNLSVNMECPDIHANVYFFYILKYSLCSGNINAIVSRRVTYVLKSFPAIASIKPVLR